MSASCPPAPEDKKAYIAEVGKILVEEYGKKKYYKPEEVKSAHKKRDWLFIFDCWGMSVYCSHSDFDAYHLSIGENCDYIEMKTEMLKGLSSSSSLDLTEITVADMDASWLDFGDIFGGIIEGIGEVVSAIFE